MNILNILLLKCLIFFGDLSFDRVAYLLGPETNLVEGIEDRYLCSPSFPLIFAFDRFGELESITLKPRFYELTRGRSSPRQLFGEWRVKSVGILPKNEINLITSISAFSMRLDPDILHYNYDLLSIDYLYQSASCGNLTRLRIYFPSAKDHKLMINNPDLDPKLSTIFVVTYGDLGISWRASNTASLGIISILIRE